MPSDANFKEPTNKGQFPDPTQPNEPTETDWNGITCEPPKKNQMYLSGQDANFEMQIRVENTTEYTVEFWFRPNVTAFAELDN